MEEHMKVPRRYDIDWIRTLALLTVFLFHTNRFFDFGGWHVKNGDTSLISQVITMFLSHWMMPLIFVISGASLFYALNNRTLGQPRLAGFLKDKILRLAVPLIFGILVLTPHQVYLERLTHGQTSQAFLQWLPQYFQGWYAFGGNFGWMGLHLWYLLILFIFSLLFLPLFLFVRDGAGAAALRRLTAFLARPGMVFLLAAPVVALVASLDPSSFWGLKDFGGWSLLAYIFFFIDGYFVFSSDDLQKAIIRQRKVALAAGVVLVIGMLAIYATNPIPDGSPLYRVVMVLLSTSSWCWIVALLGFGMKHLAFTNPFLKYATEAGLPFYVLHQPVILLIGYFVIRLNLPILVKWLIIAPTAFAIVIGLYELVRRVNLLRWLFGMKLLPTQPVKVEGREGQKLVEGD
jgi:glucan biosynthesis protein C